MHSGPVHNREEPGRCPSYALEGEGNDGHALRVVVAGCEDETKLVTAIDLDEDWPCARDWWLLGRSGAAQARASGEADRLASRCRRAGVPMHLRRIVIPEFRALKDVDLRLDAAAEPQLFPVGSENGGGKSTLLQLIFVLLSCAGAPERERFIREVLESVRHPEGQAEKLLARFELEHDGQEHVLEFVTLGRAYLDEALKGDAPSEGFWNVLTAQELAWELEETRRYKARLESISGPDALRRFNDRVEFKGLKWGYEDPRTHALLDLVVGEGVDKLTSTVTQDVIEVFAGKITEIEGKLTHAMSRETPVRHLLQAKRDHLVCIYSSDGGAQPTVLIARSGSPEAPSVDALLRHIRDRVTLIGPFAQSYLFAGDKNREAMAAGMPRHQGGQGGLFGRRRKVEPGLSGYLAHLHELSQALPGFYCYEWLSIDNLITLFQKARDQDFAAAVEQGAYGSAYTDILRDINKLLVGKQVRPLGDLSGVRFLVVDPDGQERPLGPEDLSRGELKRLMVYAWLKSNATEDSLVLMDELEVSFHPDWQYSVARDLTEWAPGVQFMLATHSYDICRAVTPAHILALEPRLPTREDDGA